MIQMGSILRSIGHVAHDVESFKAKILCEISKNVPAQFVRMRSVLRSLGRLGTFQVIRNFRSLGGSKSNFKKIRSLRSRYSVGST